VRVSIAGQSSGCSNVAELDRMSNDDNTSMYQREFLVRTIRIVRATATRLAVRNISRDRWFFVWKNAHSINSHSEGEKVTATGTPRRRRTNKLNAYYEARIFCVFRNN